MRLILTFVLPFVYVAQLYGQDGFDREAAYDVVELNELLLVYPRSSVRKSRPTSYADCADHNVALNSATLDSRTHKLIDWSMGYHARLQLVQSSLRAIADDNFHWVIEWDLVPQEGASTGITYRLRSHLSGKGEPIIPQLYFQANCEIADTTFVQCTLPVKDCARNEMSKRLAGEDVLRVARDALSGFTAGALRDTITALNGVREPIWKLHRLVLVDDLPDELGLWRVEFHDSHDSETKSITVWVSQSGKVGTLTCGHQRVEVPKSID